MQRGPAVAIMLCILCLIILVDSTAPVASGWHCNHLTLRQHTRMWEWSCWKNAPKTALLLLDRSTFGLSENSCP